MKYKGRAHKFGDNVNTDEIIPARYLNIQDPAELGRHCMENADKDFAKKVEKGDIIVAGKNFGCGSSREHACLAIKGSGVSCVIAESFARIFYRNAINMALPIVISEEGSKKISTQDAVEIDTTKGVVRDITKKKEYKSESFPPFIQKIIKKGGLLKSI